MDVGFPSLFISDLARCVTMTEELASSAIYIVLELLIALFSVLGNVLVCWAVCLNSNLQSITNFFVVSLAVADIAVGVLAIPFAIAISTGFCSNFFGCLFIACFVLVLTQNSIFSLLAIAIDRYIAIKMPLRYNSLLTSQRAQGVITICWALSIIIGLTPMMGWYKKELPKSTNNSCSPGFMRCLFEEVVDMEYMVYFNFFACVLIPLLLMLAIYLCIFMAARHQLRLIKMEVVYGEKSRSTLQKEIQVAKSLAIIVGLFAVCWLPLHIINCFNLFCPQCQRPPLWVMYVAIILSHANSVINPFIYAYRIREFQKTFCKIIRRHILGQQQVLKSSGSERNSTHNSIAGSIRLHPNTLNSDLFAEQSNSKNSYCCPAHIPPVGSSLLAMAQSPLSVVIAHCSQTKLCALHALRQTEVPLAHHHRHSEEQEHSCTGAEVLEEMDKVNLDLDQASPLFNKQNRKTCFCELERES
ncbi:adenosine A2a receptor a [Nematolebias whitei]|uniref:adenosine A2a receptor a n=1 Tax=Nematolebias whitei TaxID=451745 RepID=UPI00189AA5AD|nr:adenosine A2a receptor a [Nematolebias whitei]